MKALLCFFISIIPVLLNKEIDYKEIIKHTYPKIINKLSYSNDTSLFLQCSFGNFTVSDGKLTDGELLYAEIDVVNIKPDSLTVQIEYLDLGLSFAYSEDGISNKFFETSSLDRTSIGVISLFILFQIGYQATLLFVFSEGDLVSVTLDDNFTYQTYYAKYKFNRCIDDPLVPIINNLIKVFASESEVFFKAIFNSNNNNYSRNQDKLEFIELGY